MVLVHAPSRALPVEAVDDLLAAIALSPSLADDHLPEIPETPQQEPTQ